MNTGFAGYVLQGEAAVFVFSVANPSTGAVTEPDSLPTYRIYGDVYAIDGTTNVFESGTITGATNASPIVITSNGHNLTTGALVTVAGVTGNTNANGTRRVTVINANTFSLDGSVGNAAYISGGVWNTAAIYEIELTAQVTNSLDVGKTYTIVVSWTFSGQPRTLTMTFGVN